MAITVTELVETTSTANTSNIASAAYQPTANRGLIAFAYVTATSAVPSSVAGIGLTWTLENTTNRGAGRLWTFSALSGSSPTNTAFSFTLTGDAGTAFFVTVLEINGCDLTDHVVQTADAELAAGSTPAATFSAATTGTCAILGAVATLSNPPALTPPSTFTETMDHVAQTFEAIERESEVGPYISANLPTLLGYLGFGC